MVSITALLSASALLTAVNGHMIMATPPPYGSPNNSPLDKSGSDFPCKSTSNTGGAVTEMQIGSPQKLSFTGSAVHGGGSCQLALTTDSPAKKDSKWMVIHSIEGGCPANAEGNIGGGASGSGASTFNYKIPDGIKAGAYTLSWTWFNKVGNREMYMNCANVKITGGASKRDSYGNETYAASQLVERDGSFPDLFVANVGNGCATSEGASVQFPNPGQSVEKIGEKFAPPTGSCGAQGTQASTSSASSGAGADSGAGASGQASQSGQGQQSGGGQQPAQQPQGGASAGGVDSQDKPSSSGTPASAAPPAGGPASSPSSAPAAGSSDSQQGTKSSPPAASGAAANPPSGSSAPAQGSSPPAQGSTGSAASPQGSSGSSAPAQSATSCTKPGESICSPDQKQVGTCDQNMKALMIPVPAGTVCKGGLIAYVTKFRA